MGKILILLAVVLAIAFLVRRPGAARTATRPSGPGTRRAERMVSCAQCGVYLPVSEALTARGNHYCCEEHRRAAGR